MIGQRAEEARDAVDEFLDRAVMATASRVRIVHGFGMGVLRKMVQELLSKHPHVARYYPASQQEGGGGAHYCGTAGVDAAFLTAFDGSLCSAGSVGFYLHDKLLPAVLFATLFTVPKIMLSGRSCAV